MSVIKVDQVWKKFVWHQARARTLKEVLVSMLRREPLGIEPFWALRDVSFEVRKGETFGVVGSNGSGKSTLLKLITGISRPNKGSVTVKGKISALLELGAGFHPDFTGRENIYLNGSILGLTRQEIDACFDDIVEFSEIPEFIDQPVKTYSSGMYMRLAFSIAVKVNPDILVIDEVLAVGDSAFQDKCFKQIERFKSEGKTILIVSHDLGSLKRFCDRAAWIKKGRLVEVGEVGEVVDRFYQDLVGVAFPTTPGAENEPPAIRKRPILISGFRYESLTGEHPEFAIGAPLEVAFDYRSVEVLEDPQLVVRLIDSSTRIVAEDLSSPLDADTGTMRFGIRSLNLPPGGYTFELGFRLGDLYEPLHQAPFVVLAAPMEGQVPLECAWTPDAVLIG